MTTGLTDPVLRILVIEDQTLLRRRLIARLTENPGLLVVGEGGDGLEARRLACMRRPDAILLDATLPDGSCAMWVRILHERFGETAIVVLHPEPCGRESRGLLDAGARAVLAKEASPRDIESALRCQTQSLPLEIYADVGAVPPRAFPHRLTEREVTVLLLIAKSASNQQIATQLDIREKTVRNHVWHLSAKLGLAHRRDAAGVVASLGLTA